MSERLAQKALRLLGEGRVTVLEAGYGRPGRAIVHGDHDVYQVTFAAGNVACPCPSWQPCSHERAVRLVTEAAA